MKHLPQSGYTLTEILIALGIISVIATFTVPKLLTSTGTTQQYSTCKEVFNVIYTLLDQGMVTGDLETDGSNFGTYFMAKIKAIKKCRANSQQQGCWTTPNIADQTDQPGMILSNGAYVVGFNNLSGADLAAENPILVDWNGEQAPNTVGEDRLFLLVCYGEGTCSTGQDSGTIAPFAGMGGSEDTANETLFYKISNVQ